MSKVLWKTGVVDMKNEKPSVGQASRLSKALTSQDRRDACPTIWGLVRTGYKLFAYIIFDNTNDKKRRIQNELCMRNKRT
jgi:hypothetical protein